MAPYTVWHNKTQCEDAERAYYEKLAGGGAAKQPQPAAGQVGGPQPAAAGQVGGPQPGSLAEQIARARQHIKNSLEAVELVGEEKVLAAKFSSLELENKELRKVTEDLKSLVVSLSTRVGKLESGGAATTAVTPAAATEDDDDVDLFGSDDEEEDAEKARITAERLKAYHEKKSKKPTVIAKTSVLFDVKPWADDTDLDAMKAACLGIEMEGLVWGASKLVPVGYGIQKLQIMCTVEDEKVSIEELGEKMEAFEEFVQSVDVAAMNKI
eukprot:GFUD01016981.1.p1 GENE.GFUD01016981.1~~GFUD01016981.1.p1  ORF type:complete len:287 (+),score=109.64 GFUD01016981.1:59-862(+)